MTPAQIDVLDESQEKRSALRAAVSRETTTPEVGQSLEAITNKLVERVGVFLFYGVLFGASGWNLYRVMVAVTTNSK